MIDSLTIDLVGIKEYMTLDTEYYVKVLKREITKEIPVTRFAEFYLTADFAHFCSTSHPVILLRPFKFVSKKTSFIIDPVLDVEGYLYGEFSMYTPPVVNAILDLINTDINDPIVVIGNGIGMHLARELKKLNLQVILLSHKQKNELAIYESKNYPIVNCSLSEINCETCVLNLCSNPKQLNELTIKYLIDNIKQSVENFFNVGEAVLSKT